jgi:hypothetical protein
VKTTITSKTPTFFKNSLIGIVLLGKKPVGEIFEIIKL